jgi:hypothetical protein
MVRTMSWINGNGFIPNDTWALPGTSTSGPYPPGSPGYLGYGTASSDAVRPAWFGGATLPGGALNPMADSTSGGLGGILAQLASQVQQSIAKLSNALMGTSAAPSTNTGTNVPSGSATFQNVALASAGDPHLSAVGTEVNADGSTAGVSSHFDSMTSHTDLFSTRDFGDGFRVSTSVTQPAANGVTQNASATATMDGGRETVSMNNSGAVSITDHGRSVALAAGQSVTLTGGQQVSESAGGAVSIAESAFGENLTTTFTQNGGGVDVTATGQNVTLSGALITGGTTPVAQAPANVRAPYVRV